LQIGHLLTPAGTSETIEEILLLDTALPNASDRRLRSLQADIADPAALQAVAQWKPDCVFHLAAVLTSAAEQDPARGWAVNVAALMALIEAIANTSAPPRLIFPSSIAVFGGLLPDHVDDDHLQRPQTSYGTHKAIGELMLADATRHGVIDARTLRLPVVLVHPGPPTQSLSDRLAAMLRDGAAGRPALCPLRPDTKLAVVSVQTVVQNLITLHNAAPAKLRGKRMLNQPGLTVSMTDIAESIARISGAAPDIRFAPDAELKKIIDGWPKGLISTRAPSVGVIADNSFDDIVLNYLSFLATGKSAA
jgi:nucleoside-diphosphate-sugar epimerase